MVKRLAVIAALLLGVLVFAPTAIGFAQPASEDPGTSETEEAPAEEDLYAPCRDLGDGLSGPLGTLAEKVCDVGQAVANPTEAAGEFKSGLWDSAVGEAAEVFLEGWQKGITFMLTWWMTNSVTGPIGNSDTESTVANVHQYLRIFQIAILVVSIGISAVKLAYAKQRYHMQHAEEAARVMTRTVFASWMLVPLVIVGDEVSRAGGQWLIQAMVGDNIEGALSKLLSVAQIGGMLGPGLIFVFSLLGIIGTAVQVVFIIIQIALLRVVLGWAPIAAASTGLQGGLQAYRKLTAWCVVFVLFPFVASSVYGIAFLSAASASDAQGVFAGMILLTLSFLTMPALARLIVPAMGSMAGGSGAAALGGALAATGAAAGMSGMLKGMGGSGGGQSSSTTSSTQGGRSEPPTGAGPGSGGQGATGPKGPTGGGGGAGTSGAGSSAAAGGASKGAAAAAGPAGAAVAVGAEAAKKVGQAVGAVASSVSGAAERGSSGPDLPQGGRSV